MGSDFLFAAANEADLNDLVSGRDAGYSLPWSGRHTTTRVQAGSVGVLWKQPQNPHDPVKPLVIVAREEEHRRLFGRFAQLRGDLSPLSAWCHLVTPSRFESLDLLSREADLSGLEAAWVGLVVAESLLLAERPINQLKIAACLSTQSFALARAKALWGNISTKEFMGRYDACQNLLSRSESRMMRLRVALDPVWTCLTAATFAGTSSIDREVEPMVRSLRALEKARSIDDPEEATKFIEPLREVVPEVERFARLPSWTPEQRVQEFDRILAELEQYSSDGKLIVQHTLALLAGYLTTVAAGGSPSLSLAEANSLRWPQITAWAYILGGIGERIIWTSSFDGLGRLVARELMRPLRLDEAPTCDFALDEATVLVDRQLANPLVHLRIKQLRIVTVGLLPGVNVLIPIGDQPPNETKQSDGKDEWRSARYSNRVRAHDDALAVLADAIWPYLQSRLENAGRAARKGGSPPGSHKSQKGRPRKRSSSQSKLPLTESTKN